MSLNEPADAKPGLVIRYSFLWNTEKAQGAAEGSKDRPCVIVVAARRDSSEDITTSWRLSLIGRPVVCYGWVKTFSLHPRLGWRQ